MNRVPLKFVISASFPASASLLVQVSGCTGSDGDFDGVPYGTNWPGTGPSASDAALHPSPIVVSSPLTNGSNYQQAAFEADMPRIERSDFGGTCNGSTGANCVNPPPPGAAFYPDLLHHHRQHGLRLAGRRPAHPRHHQRLRTRCPVTVILPGFRCV